MNVLLPSDGVARLVPRNERESTTQTRLRTRTRTLRMGKPTEESLPVPTLATENAVNALDDTVILTARDRTRRRSLRSAPKESVDLVTLEKVAQTGTATPALAEHALAHRRISRSQKLRLTSHIALRAEMFIMNDARKTPTMPQTAPETAETVDVDLDRDVRRITEKPIITHAIGSTTTTSTSELLYLTVEPRQSGNRVSTEPVVESVPAADITQIESMIRLDKPHEEILRPRIRGSGTRTRESQSVTVQMKRDTRASLVLVVSLTQRHKLTETSGGRERMIRSTLLLHHLAEPLTEATAEENMATSLLPLVKVQVNRLIFIRSTRVETVEGMFSLALLGVGDVEAESLSGVPRQRVSTLAGKTNLLDVEAMFRVDVTPTSLIDRSVPITSKRLSHV